MTTYSPELLSDRVDTYYPWDEQTEPEVPSHYELHSVDCWDPSDL